MHRDWRPLSLLMQVGGTIAGSIVLFLLLGLWIDNHFGTSPVATLALMFFGLLVGSVTVYRIVSEAISVAESERLKPDRPDEETRSQQEDR